MKKILLILLVIVLLGLGYYFYSQNKGDGYQITTNDSGIYVNEKYGFEFNKTGEVKEGVAILQSQQLEGLSYDWDNIYVYTKPQEALNTWVKNSFKMNKILGFAYKPKVYDVIETEINGYRAVEVTYDHYADYGKDIFIEHPTEKVIVNFRYPGRTSDFDLSPQEEAVLKSFKFFPVNSPK